MGPFASTPSILPTIFPPCPLEFPLLPISIGKKVGSGVLVGVGEVLGVAVTTGLTEVILVARTVAFKVLEGLVVVTAVAEAVAAMVGEADGVLLGVAVGVEVATIVAAGEGDGVSSAKTFTLLKILTNTKNIANRADLFIFNFP